MNTTKILLCVFSIMLVGGNSYSQEFAPIGSKWTYQNLGLGSSAMGFPVAYQFRTEKDTSIDNRYCTVINGYNLYEDGSWEQTGSEIVAASENGDTVYVYFQDSFHLIYDFTAAVGDTIEVTNEKFDGLFRQSSIQQNQFIYKIDSILSVPFNLDTLLIQYVSYLSPPEIGTPEWGFGDAIDIGTNTPGRIIKGIGALSRAAPLGTSSGISYFSESEPDYLTCYEDENSYYQFGDIDCDSLIALYTLINSVTSEAMNDGKVFPNPFTKSISIDYETSEVAYLRLFNVDGRIIKGFKPETMKNMDFSYVPSGNYFLSILFHNGKISTYHLIKK